VGDDLTALRTPATVCSVTTGSIKGQKDEQGNWRFPDECVSFQGSHFDKSGLTYCYYMILH